MGSLHDFDAAHWDHEPLTARSPGFSRPKPFEPPKGGTPNQPRFMESLHAFLARIGTRNRTGAPASGTASCCASVVAQTAVSAVSRVANPLAVRRSNASPISNRRYGRLGTCATEHRFMERENIPHPTRPNSLKLS